MCLPNSATKTAHRLNSGSNIEMSSDSEISGDSEVASDSDFPCSEDYDLCHYCEDEPSDSKCELCNCWEYECRASDPWACSETCECESCTEYRTTFPFPLLQYLGSPLTPSTLYDNSTVYELRQFVRSRGLKDPQPGALTHKHLYYRILRAADEKTSFRFLDLPAEMRNHVYRDLLIFSRAGAAKKTACYPAILRVSRQIQEEGKGIVYGENVFRVKIAQDYTTSASIKKSLCVHDENFPITCLHNKFSQIPEGIDAYPEVFRRIQQLHIEVKFTCMDTGRDWVHGSGSWDFINKCLLTLSSNLMEGNSLEKVKIEFETVTTNLDRGSPEEWEIGRMLYPLRRLRNVKKVEVTGDLPKRMAKVITDEMQSKPAKVPHNTVRHWKLLTTEAYARIQLMQHLHGIECACGAWHLPMESCMLDLQEALQTVEEYDSFQSESPGIQSSIHEENVQVRLARLQRVLRAARAAELKAKFDAFIKAEKERRRYDREVGQEVLMDAEKKWGDVDIDDEDGIETAAVRDDWNFKDYEIEDVDDLAK